MRSHSNTRPAQSRTGIWFRDTYLLFREFRWPLLIFVITIVIAGTIYHNLRQLAGLHTSGYISSIYTILNLVFLQTDNALPEEWYLQIFYFLMPIIGIGILASGLADFGRMLFNKRARGKEWEMVVASTFSDHIVLVGLGHLGFRVSRHLHYMGKKVVAIDLDPRSDLLDSIRGFDIPVITDDAIKDTVLKAAAIHKAQAIVLCTQNDSLNLQVGLKARNYNPDIKVIVRIFDNDFANSLKTQFGFHALSATEIASPIFAASATDMDITPPITIEGQPNSLARLHIPEQSKLVSLKIEEIEDKFSLSVVLLKQSDRIKFHPDNDLCICAGDTIAVLGSPESINQLVQNNC